MFNIKDSEQAKTLEEIKLLVREVAYYVNSNPEENRFLWIRDNILFASNVFSRMICDDNVERFWFNITPTNSYWEVIWTLDKVE